MSTGSSASYGIGNNYGSSKIGKIINSGLITGIGEEESNGGIWIAGGTNVSSKYWFNNRSWKEEWPWNLSRGWYTNFNKYWFNNRKK